MLANEHPVLDCPPDRVPEPEELLRAALRWHFDPRTGSPFWLRRARSLDFDPVRDVHTFDDLRLFPNVVDELRETRVEDLVPRGYGDSSGRVRVYESGGTTGAPKRVVFTDDWLERSVAWSLRNMSERGHPEGLNWLALAPAGPHMFGEIIARQARARGGLLFTVDFDPRWVKKCVAQGRTEEAARYTEHLLEQAGHVLATQDVGVLVATPPLLERIARDARLTALVNKNVRLIRWSGAHMDPDTRDLLRDEVFPEVELSGGYGSTMILGGVDERPDTEGVSVFDPFSPYMSFRVVDPETGAEVPYGERGQVVMNHVSKTMLLVNNLERDTALRVRSREGQVGDSLGDVEPLASFGGRAAIEGVY
ncbi:AMP-binding protein [Nocardiopsis sp. JB363]|uniref:AMP-binding protein n=1 Tax=Nocardiopsis sp. JB363 TaxID=1434837 RepID=UPI00097A413A|nr:AMP-binding protein [Nocardiopsis sp. JB363]SIO88826.1 EhpF [Nocardiopsis sp. JB363]